MAAKRETIEEKFRKAEADPGYGVFSSAKRAARFRELTEKAMDYKLASIDEFNEWARLYVSAKGELPEGMTMKKGKLVYKETGEQVVPAKLIPAGKLGKAKVYKVK